MKNIKVIYILIGIFCVFAIVAGVYAEFFVKPEDKENIIVPNLNTTTEPEVKEKSQEEIKAQFDSLFTNKFNQGQYNTSLITKVDNSKDVIYSAADIKEEKENYEIDIHLPVINISGEVPTSFNNITQTIFFNKAQEVLSGKSTSKILYRVNYVAYINDDILSLVIQSTLKEGNNPQRVIVQTYNYNLTTKQKVEAADLISKKNIVQSECQKKISSVVEKAVEEAQILVQSGYPSVYNRDVTSEMYKIANLSTYFLGPNKELYIIFAYGNNNFTSAMDIVLYE